MADENSIISEPSGETKDKSPIKKSTKIMLLAIAGAIAVGGIIYAVMSSSKKSTNSGIQIIDLYVTPPENPNKVIAQIKNFGTTTEQVRIIVNEIGESILQGEMLSLDLINYNYTFPDGITGNFILIVKDVYSDKVFDSKPFTI